MILFLFQDSVGILGKVAEQGTAIFVLFLILVFVYFLLTKYLPVWEKVKTSESSSREAMAKSLGELALSQSQTATSNSQMAVVLREIAVEQRKSTEMVKILQRVNTETSEQLTGDVQELNATLQHFNERLDRLESEK